jgi:putative membrane protein
MISTNPTTMKRAFLNIIFLAACLLLIKSSAAFVAKDVRRSRVISTQLHIRNKDAPLEELELSYGEQSRPYRRDFFSHDLWVKHRAPFRFTRNLANLLQSGVVRQLFGEILVISAVSALIVAWNALLVTGFDDFSYVHHPPLIDVGLPLLKLPTEPFTLSSPALSLLLGMSKKVFFWIICLCHMNSSSLLLSAVFRTNASYKRWDEARKAWGVIVNNSRTILRQTSSWIAKADLPASEKQRIMRRVADAVWLFPRAEQRHLLSAREDEEAYQQAVRERLSPALAEDLISFQRHRPSRALYELSSAINEIPIELFRRVSVDESVSHLCDAMGGKKIWLRSGSTL